MKISNRYCVTITIFAVSLMATSIAFSQDDCQSEDQSGCSSCEMGEPDCSGDSGGESNEEGDELVNFIPNPDYFCFLLAPAAQQCNQFDHEWDCCEVGVECEEQPRGSVWLCPDAWADPTFEYANMPPPLNVCETVERLNEDAPIDPNTSGLPISSTACETITVVCGYSYQCFDYCEFDMDDEEYLCTESTGWDEMTESAQWPQAIQLGLQNLGVCGPQ
ncbi:MAG: hypothetical protein WBD31_21360 [Rubripirellula sp.]